MPVAPRAQVKVSLGPSPWAGAVLPGAVRVRVSATTQNYSMYHFVSTIFEQKLATLIHTAPLSNSSWHIAACSAKPPDYRKY